MLHIVNGDAVGDKLKQGTIRGEILVWRELYTEGPIFLQDGDTYQGNIRTKYMENELGIPHEHWVNTNEEQARLLANFTEHEEVVLWFEHDLFDQTMLCYLLHWFSQKRLDRTKLSLLCIGEFPGIAIFHGLGQLSVEQLSSLFSQRQVIGQDVLQLGKKAWETYASPDPRSLSELLQEDTSALAYLRDAFLIHLARFPSPRNGLGITEQTTLELIRSGSNTPLTLFQKVGDSLHRLGMGDLQYWLILRRMSEGSYPLIEVDGQSAFPKFGQPVEPFLNTRIRLTDLGRSMLTDYDCHDCDSDSNFDSDIPAQDWVACNGINQWLGGVHLHGKHNVWRWNPVDFSFIRS